QVAASYKLGIAFPFQIVGEIPTEPHDIQMDEVLEI
ncbi:MAG: 5-formyltetrahydrofolate cyclo-ligase, partial [Alloprevotella sp.]|nr:5-formyltetrahydrofolate cyclo-ligase [Alloprevotella sp.]